MGRVGLAVPSRSHNHRQPEFDPRIDAQKIVLTLTLTLTLIVRACLQVAIEDIIPELEDALISMDEVRVMCRGRVRAGCRVRAGSRVRAGCRVRAR